MYLKILLLQKWFNLPDPMAEEMLADRLSLRRFVGLSLSDVTPDETSMGNFRRALLAHDLIGELFARVQAHLDAHGLLVKEGTLVDATILEAPLGNKRSDGSSTADPCASKTVKGGRAYFGYKGHLATDRRGLITDYLIDTASPHDSRHLDQLTENETQGVYADSAYMDQKRKAALEKDGIFCGIVYKRVKGQKELTAEQRTHNRFVAGIRAWVEHPFAWMAQMGFTRVRYRGLRRNGLDLGLMAIAYNLKRAMSLACLLP
jgi:IS5 family transposase